MAVNSTGQAQPTAYAPTSFSAGVGSGVRQAAALIGGAVETTQTIQREARFVQRREPAPFQDKVDVRAAAKNDDPAPAPEEKKPAETRQLSLTGQPVADKPVNPPGRGNLVDVDA